ncbi:MAG: hypothetical protein JSR96_03020 [Proteobacteria bacterium]|nr:hypothetical protein [Pseudomonadota bacterium]
MKPYQSFNLDISRYRRIVGRGWPFVAALTVVAGLGGCGKSQDKAMATGALAQQQYQAGLIAEARRTVRDAIRQSDDIPQLYLLQGRIEMAAGDRENAYAAYSQALALDASNTEALQAVAQLGLQTGHVIEAEDAINRMLALNPGDPSALIASGLLQLSRNKDEQALETADHMLKDNPGNALGLLLKTRALLVLGKPDEALKTVNSLGNDPKQARDITLMKLEIARVRHDAAGMLAAFEALRGLLPEDLDLRADEVNLAYKTGDTARARKVLAAALQSRSLNEAWALKFVNLIAEYDRTPFDGPGLAEFGGAANRAAVEALGRFYITSGQYEAAKALFANAADRAPPAIRARLDAAAGREAEAQVAADQVLESDKTNCDALLARANLSLRKQQADAALLAAQTAQSQCPLDAGGWVLLASAYDMKQDSIGVRRVFEQGIAANPRQSFLTARYIDWLIRNGQASRALGPARRLAVNAPALRSGWELYGKVAAAAKDSSAAAEAARGLQRANTLLGIDIPSGEPPPRGMLFQRLPQR